MATLYVTLQGKGGVGKSYLTAAFAQWLVAQGRSVACIDTDTLNPTLLQYAPLKATHLPPSGYIRRIYLRDATARTPARSRPRKGR